MGFRKGFLFFAAPHSFIATSQPQWVQKTSWFPPCVIKRNPLRDDGGPGRSLGNLWDFPFLFSVTFRHLLGNLLPPLVAGNFNKAWGRGRCDLEEPWGAKKLLFCVVRSLGTGPELPAYSVTLLGLGWFVLQLVLRRWQCFYMGKMLKAVTQSSGKSGNLKKRWSGEAIGAGSVTRLGNCWHTLRSDAVTMDKRDIVWCTIVPGSGRPQDHWLVPAAALTSPFAILWSPESDTHLPHTKQLD